MPIGPRRRVVTQDVERWIPAFERVKKSSIDGEIVRWAGGNDFRLDAQAWMPAFAGMTIFIDFK